VEVCVHTSLIYHQKGADDDGSGTVTILEAYRALLESDFRPNRTVEFHWYSAEVRPIHYISTMSGIHGLLRRLVSWALKPSPRTTGTVVSRSSP